jgi:putative membrane-bound dehydrogenase-like protein
MQLSARSRIDLFLILFISFSIITEGCRGRSDASVKNEAENALSTFELEPGLKMELIAHEPLISDPVDMEIDEFGRLYVVEMHGYPLDKSGSGKIMQLADTTGDGRMDKSIVFAEGLVLPNSIMRWKKGFLVTDAPNVLYLEDTDGDGRADIRDTMLTGFALSNPQHNLNSPLLGLDNWIYLAHEGAVSTETYQQEFGDPGREVYYPKQPGAPRLPVNANGRSVRFRPDDFSLETTSSRTQFGHSFDAWGHHFLVGNANHIYQEVIAAPYLKRNPELLVSEASQNLSDHGNAAEVFPITRNPEHQLLTDVGVITSACGITAYLGGAFPAAFNENVTFVAEPVSNLIHADRLSSKGASFTASRIHPAKEFLASTDSWFRPVNMYTGPDGALYVVDYYRQIIEHPEWMGEEVVKSGQLYNGKDKGRIYRIVPKNAGPANWAKGLRLGNAGSEELVEKLAGANLWWRMNAQRLLVDRRDMNAIPALEQMAQNRDSPFGRLHALWTLEGMGELKPALIEKALKDSVPGVRENAVKLAELHLPSAPGLATSLIAMQEDADAKVRYQLLCTLGFVNSPQAAQVRNKLLFRDLSDPWVQVAALSASSETASLLHAVLDSFQPEVPAYVSLVQRLSAMIGAGAGEAMIQPLVQKATIAGTEQQGIWQAAVLKGLAQGLQSKRKGSSFNGKQDLFIKTFFEHPSGEVRRASLDMLRVIGLPKSPSTKSAVEQAARVAADRTQPEAKRVEVIRFIALGDPAPHAAMLQQLITPREPSSIQVAALHALGKKPGIDVAQYVLQQWADLTPEVREEALNAFSKDDPARIKLLLDAIEEGRVQPASIGWPRSVWLMMLSDKVLRDRARMLLTKNEGEQVKVNQAYQQVLTLKGDPVKGKAIYSQHCASCHQVRGGMGVNFGPDLGTVHNWSAEAIMANILAPNLSISSGYELWIAELKNGESVQGIIAAESPTTVTLINAARVERSIRREDISALKAMNMSAMPVGLEKQINQQQMADLLAFLKQNK